PPDVDGRPAGPVLPFFPALVHGNGNCWDARTELSRRTAMKESFILPATGRRRALPVCAAPGRNSAPVVRRPGAARGRRAGWAWAAAGLLWLGLCGAAGAQLLPVETSQGIEYVSGGIGSDASAAFKAAKADYPLALTFAAVGDDGSAPYVAQVHVEIANERGERV